MEWRKHYTSMSKRELDLISIKIRSCNFEYSEHLYEMIYERNIGEKDVNSTIKHGSVVEFHYVDGDCRILIRGNKIIEGSVVCVVLSINKENIITAYKNRYLDEHFTLQQELYDDEKDLLKYIENMNMY